MAAISYLPLLLCTWCAFMPPSAATPLPPRVVSVTSSTVTLQVLLPLLARNASSNANSSSEAGVALVQIEALDASGAWAPVESTPRVVAALDADTAAVNVVASSLFPGTPWSFRARGVVCDSAPCSAAAAASAPWSGLVVGVVTLPAPPPAPTFDGNTARVGGPTRAVLSWSVPALYPVPSLVPTAALPGLDAFSYRPAAFFVEHRLLGVAAGSNAAAPAVANGDAAIATVGVWTAQEQPALLRAPRDAVLALGKANAPYSVTCTTATGTVVALNYSAMLASAEMLARSGEPHTLVAAVPVSDAVLPPTVTCAYELAVDGLLPLGSYSFRASAVALWFLPAGSSHIGSGAAVPSGPTLVRSAPSLPTTKVRMRGVPRADLPQGAMRSSASVNSDPALRPRSDPERLFEELRPAGCAAERVPVGPISHSTATVHLLGGVELPALPRAPCAIPPLPSGTAASGYAPGIAVGGWGGDGSPALFPVVARGGDGLVVMSVFYGGDVAVGAAATLVVRYGGEGALQPGTPVSARVIELPPVWGVIDEPIPSAVVFSLPTHDASTSSESAGARVHVRAWGAGGGCGAATPRPASAATLSDSGDDAALFNSTQVCVPGGAGGFVDAWLSVQPQQRVVVALGVGGAAGAQSTGGGAGGWPGGGNGGSGMAPAGGGGGATAVWLLPPLLSDAATAATPLPLDAWRELTRTIVPAVAAGGGGGGGSGGGVGDCGDAVECGGVSCAAGGSGCGGPGCGSGADGGSPVPYGSIFSDSSMLLQVPTSWATGGAGGSLSSGGAPGMAPSSLASARSSASVLTPPGDGTDASAVLEASPVSVPGFVVEHMRSSSARAGGWLLGGDGASADRTGGGGGGGGITGGGGGGAGVDGGGGGGAGACYVHAPATAPAPAYWARTAATNDPAPAPPAPVVLRASAAGDALIAWLRDDVPFEAYAVEALALTPGAAGSTSGEDAWVTIWEGSGYSYVDAMPDALASAAARDVASLSPAWWLPLSLGERPLNASASAAAAAYLPRVSFPPGSDRVFSLRIRSHGRSRSAPTVSNPSNAVIVTFPDAAAPLWTHVPPRAADARTSNATVRGAPPPLSGASLTPLAGYALLFGGLTGGEDCASDILSPPPCPNVSFVSNDTWSLDPVSLSWSQLPIPRALAPPPREGHVAATLGDRLYVVSGRGHPDTTRDGGPFLSDMWVLETGAQAEASRSTLHAGPTTIPVSHHSNTGTSLGRDLSCGFLSQGTLNASLVSTCGIPELQVPTVSMRIVSDSQVSASQAAAAATPGGVPASDVPVPDGACIADIAVWVEVAHPCLAELSWSLLGPGPSTLDTELGAEGNATQAERFAAPEVVLFAGGGAGAQGSASRTHPCFSANGAAAGGLTRSYLTGAARGVLRGLWGDAQTAPPPLPFAGGGGDVLPKDGLDSGGFVFSPRDRLTSDPHLAVFRDDAHTPSASCCAPQHVAPPSLVSVSGSNNGSGVPLGATLGAGYAALPPTPPGGEDVTLVRGFFAPRDSLNAAFRGTPAVGTWSLRITDSRANTARGVLLRWGLALSTQPCSPAYAWTRLYPPLNASELAAAAAARAVYASPGSPVAPASSKFVASLPPLTSMPPARAYAATVAIGGSVFLWGGVGVGVSYTGTLSRDLWRYDAALNAWTQLAAFDSNFGAGEAFLARGGAPMLQPLGPGLGFSGALSPQGLLGLLRSFSVSDGAYSGVAGAAQGTRLARGNDATVWPFSGSSSGEWRSLAPSSTGSACASAVLNGGASDGSGGVGPAACAAPSPRSHAAVAVLGTRGSRSALRGASHGAYVVVYGGADAATDEPLSDTWMLSLPYSGSALDVAAETEALVGSGIGGALGMGLPGWPLEGWTEGYASSAGDASDAEWEAACAVELTVQSAWLQRCMGTASVSSTGAVDSSGVYALSPGCSVPQVLRRAWCERAFQSVGTL